MSAQELSDQISRLAAQVEKTKGTQASAAQLLQGFATAIQTRVAEALEADAKADEETLRTAANTIREVTDQFMASTEQLGAAVAANQTPA